MSIPDWLMPVISRLLRVIFSQCILKFYLSPQERDLLVQMRDPVRYGAVSLAIDQIKKDSIPGSLAEGGVYKGRMSKFIHDRLPERKLFLFDSFEGFDRRDTGNDSDKRFRDTTEESVLDYIGDTRNIIVRKGYFPETAFGLEDERFVFVMIDFDKYKPTLAALEFFYPRTSPGGVIFVHDYSSPESNWACSKALNKFLSDKPEKPLLIPDACGSAFFRKV